jgi:hypothetical protein
MPGAGGEPAPEMPDEPNAACAYILSYFRTEAEALHLAVSDDGLAWEPLNGNRPVLTGTVGTKTLRDPFVCRDPETGRFHLLATDGWNSDGIVHAASDDLRTWGEQTRVPVMASVPGTRNAWAPEAFRDVEEGVWRVIWSSSTRGRDADYDHRIWEASTADFAAFSAPSVFFDPGYSVIDATVHRGRDGRYLMAYKDEHGENRPGTANKAMRVCTAERATGPWSAPSDLVTPALTEGPTIFEAPDGALVMLYDHFLDGHFGARRSTDGGATWHPLPDEAALRLPPGPRHAGVLRVEPEVVERLHCRLG